MTNSFRVIALISSFNEGDIISVVIRHLIENGVDVYLLDNHSTDDTTDQAAQWLGKGLLDIEIFPPVSEPEDSAVFDWTAILQRKETLSRTLEADWFMHHDADEFRESPWPGMTLSGALSWVDKLGFNCVDYRILDFPPVDDGFKQGDDPRTYFRYFKEAAEFDKMQLKSWKATAAPVSLVTSGGHQASFEGRRIFPIPFLLRHYPIRGQTHGVRKVFGERLGRFREAERSRGWHRQYNAVADEQHLFLHAVGELQRFDLDRVRLESMLPDAMIQNLSERLLRADSDLQTFRSLAEAELEGHHRHITNLENERTALQREVDNLRPLLEQHRASCDALQQERDGLKQHTANLEQILGETRSAVAAIEQARDESEQYASDLERASRQYQQQIADLELLLAEFRHQAPVLERQREHLMLELSNAQRELSALKNSRSWQWTAPLRWVAGIIGRGS